MKSIKYLPIALKNFKTVGNFIPSQKFLVNKLTKDLKKDSKCIVEFGTGEGCVTRGIENMVNDGCIILSFEINPKMIEMAIKNNKRKNTHYINDDVLNVDIHLKKLKIEKVDHVVSCLPLGHFKKETINSILENVKKILSDEGTYIQYQYLAKNLKDVKKHFKKTSIKFVPLNTPPAFVYICKK